MKKIFLIAAFVILPALMFGQTIFEKYADNDDVTYISIKPKMFQMLAKIDVSADDPEAKQFMDMVNSITSLKVLVTSEKAISTDIAKWVGKRSTSLEELMEVKDKEAHLRFYVKEGRDDDHVKELLMFITDFGSQDIKIQDRKIETVVVSFTGDIDLRQVSKLTDKMDIPGGKHLNKASKN